MQCSGGLGSILFLIITLFCSPTARLNTENKRKTKGDSDSFNLNCFSVPLPMVFVVSVIFVLCCVVVTNETEHMSHVNLGVLL